MNHYYRFQFCTALVAFTMLFLSTVGMAQTTITGTIKHDGLIRDYRLYIPKNFDSKKAVPLVFNFHGLTSNAQQQEFYGDFRGIADTAGFLLVHPNGTVSKTAGVPFWNVGLAVGESVDDVGFVEALIDSLQLKYTIDPNRIYATGMSNGGFMSYFLACSSLRFAAIASVTGSSTPLMDQKCKSSRAVPILEIHGTADNTVPYNGTTGIKAIPALVAFWAAKNGCNPTPQINQVANTNTADGATAEHHIYSTSTGDALVEHFKVIGGGHTWPGSIFPIGVTCQDFNASKEIWRFFSQFKLITNNNDLHHAEVKIFPNPAIEKINILQSKYNELKVYSIDGAITIHLKNTSTINDCDISYLKPGIYTMELSNNQGRVVTKFVKI